MSKVERLLDTFRKEGRVGVRSGPVKKLGIALLSLVVLLIGVVVLASGGTDPRDLDPMALVDPLLLSGWIMLVAGVLGVGVGIWSAISPKPRFIIGREGVTQQGYTVAWRDVRGVSIMEVEKQRFVVLELDDSGRARLEEQAGMLTRINASFAGGNLVLFNQVALNVEEVRELVVKVRAEVLGEAFPTV